MNLLLEKATIDDAKTIFDMQVKAFMPLLEKYQDYHASPANEKLEKAIARITNPNGGFYKIIFQDELVGAICISRKEKSQWISPMFILPEYQGKGIAQEALVLLEEMFSDSKYWELATIQEEVRNCYLYEKMGYVRTGVEKRINENATLIYYKKVME